MTRQWRILVVVVAPMVSACSTMGWTEWGQTDPVIFYDVQDDELRYEPLVAFGIGNGQATSQLVIQHTPASDTAKDQPSAPQGPGYRNAMYEVDLFQCSQMVGQQGSGTTRLGNIVSGTMGGMLMGAMIGGPAGGLRGIALGSLAGGVTGAVVGSQASVQEHRLTDQQTVAQCMALRGHRVVGATTQ